MKKTDQSSYFLLSLDTELAWGYFDCFNPKNFSKDGGQERQSIYDLLDIFREFNIHVTWGLVGHLFYEKCEKCEICPVKKWEGQHASFSQIYDTASPLWYGPDLIDAILDENEMHEIAFHGYTHRVFNEKTMSRDEARLEIEEWLRLAQRKEITPRSVIFPRNVIGHLDLFKEYGFTCYRGDELQPEISAIPVLGRGVKRYHRYLSSFIRAPGYHIEESQFQSLLNIPSTQHLFGYEQEVSSWVNTLNLHKLNIQTVTDGIRKSTREKKIFHLRAHPNDFRSEKDLEIMRGICRVVSEEVKNGHLTSIGMADLAENILKQEMSMPALAGA